MGAGSAPRANEMTAKAVIATAAAAGSTIRIVMATHLRRRGDHGI
jgi:hypothetical protein